MDELRIELAILRREFEDYKAQTQEPSNQALTRQELEALRDNAAELCRLVKDYTAQVEAREGLSQGQGGRRRERYPSAMLARERYPSLMLANQHYPYNRYHT